MVETIKLQEEKTMQITDVRIRLIENESKMKAVVAVTFDNEFVVHDIKIVDNGKGLFVAMPSRKTPDGEFKDVCHPIKPAFREYVAREIMAKFETIE